MPDPEGLSRTLVHPPDEAPAWQAHLEIGLADRAGRTVLTHKRQQGPLTVQRPFYPEGSPAHVYLLHPPGGVVGGDRLTLAVSVGAAAHALITTPGAAKFYRSGGPRANQVQALTVAAGGTLEWLPQENIFFPAARVQLSTEVNLAAGARFLGWEVHALGRPAVAERFDPGDADLALGVRRDGVPLLLERLRIINAVGLDGPSGLRGFPVTGTLIASGAAAEDLAAVRAHPTQTDSVLWGATLVNDLLIARCLARGSEPVHRLFAALWGILRPRLLGRPACPPRIWST
jgi:urease accessory protein